MTVRRADGSRVRTVFLGSGPFATGILDVLAAHPAVDVVGVVTAPPRPAGRGRQLEPTVIERRARALVIERILTPERLRAADATESVLALEPGLVVLADYGQLVPGAILRVAHGALNLHPSLLPRHRGATPIPAAILAGDRQTGVTLMQMDEGLDTGPIAAQRIWPLDGTETAPILGSSLGHLAAELLAEELGRWLDGAIAPVAQPVDGVTVTRALRREDGRLDPRHSSAALERQVRAYQPWPGSFIDTIAGRIVVWRAADADRTGSALAGELDPIGLATGDGRRLILEEVQPAGRGRMSWDALLRGRPSLIGSTVVPGR